MRTAFLLVLCFLPVLGSGSTVQSLAAQQQDQKLCPDCKYPLKPNAKFCNNCGAKIEAPAPKPAEPAPGKGSQEPAKPAGEMTDPNAVKQQLDEDLRKFGTSAEEVNRAIDRGAAYLAAFYLKHGFSSDDDYLGAYALIHTNQYFANGKLRDKINAFLKADNWQKSGAAVYTAALRALSLEATHDPDLKALTREVAEYLVEAQGPKGTWTYMSNVPIVPVIPPVKEVSGIQITGGEPLDEEVKGELITRKNTSKNPGDGDTSCTQFAILGLHAAARCGYSVPKEVWAKCLKEMEDRVCKDGGWGYHYPSENSYGSMTCAGICTVALCRFYLGEKDYLDSPKMKAGIEWLAKNFEVSKNPKANDWPLYYLYSVERVGVFAATESIGEHRWYGKGAKFLVGSQLKDGSWTGPSEHTEKGTAFALLFLTRATSPVKNVKRGGNGWLETHALNDASNFMIILDASGSMHEEIDGKEKFDIAREVIEEIVKRLGEGAKVGLRVYGHRVPSLDEKADTDSELVIPIGPLNQAQFLAKVKMLKARGKTPLTYSLMETIKDVSSVDSELDLVTILLTDGGESTRGSKPHDAAAKLAAARKGMKVHVVGFDINEDDWREQLEKTAAAGNGQYFHVRKSSDLLAALSLVTVGGADYSLLDKAGKAVHAGKLGDRRELPEGKYTIVIESGGKKEEKVVWINTGVVSHATVSMARILKR